MRASARTIPVREKIAYGIGDISNGLAVSSVGFWLLIYLTDVAGLGAFLAGATIMVGRAWDAITDPVMGWITDRTESRWGKRRPYLLFGAIPYALAFFAMWTVPELQSQMALFIYVTIVLIVFNTTFTVVFVPYTSLTAAITSDYNERTSLTGYRMFCSQIAFLIGASLPSYAVMLVATDDFLSITSSIGIHDFFGTWAGTSRQGYFLMAAIAAVIMVASVWTTFFGCQERTDLRSAEQRRSAPSPFSYLRAILVEFRENKPFRYSVSILLFTNCAATFIAVNLPYYLQYSVDVYASQTSLIALLFLVAIAFVPIWVRITRKYGKAETYRIAMIFYAMVLMALPFVEPRSITALYVIAALAGVFHSAALLIPWAIVPDVVEYDELNSGMRREGLFYGGTTLIYKLATALAVFMSGAILAMIGYQPNQPQAEFVIRGMNLIVGPLPALLLLTGALLSLRYPLTEARHMQIVKELAQKE